MLEIARAGLVRRSHQSSAAQRVRRMYRREVRLRCRVIDRERQLAIENIAEDKPGMPVNMGRGAAADVISTRIASIPCCGPDNACRASSFALDFVGTGGALARNEPRSTGQTRKASGDLVSRFLLIIGVPVGIRSWPGDKTITNSRPHSAFGY